MLTDQTTSSSTAQSLSQTDHEEPHLTIRPSKGWVPLKLNELWEYRELLYFLTWRDIKVRYKQTIVGLAWAIIQPLMTMLVFSVFFGQLAQMPSDGVPYFLFSLAALVPWVFFSTGLANASSSLVGSANLLKKIYFPRVVIPLSAVFSGVVDFLVSFVLLILLMLLRGIVPTVNVLWLPFFLLLAFITAFGVGLWLSAMNVQFRDIQYVIPFLVQFWLFASPIAYPSSLIKNDLARAIYAINPMVGVIEGFRWALLGTNTAPGPMILVSTLVAVIVMVSGLYYFRRMEKTFADVV
jgi:lipopolysaccharide transport system permease protein